MIQLKNEKLTIILDEKGAELSSIKFNGHEYLWQADPKYWGKHSPVLFPIVGELKNGTYYFENSEYKLSRHGFARDKVFEYKKISGVTALFTLKANKETLEVYPFHFVFQVQYEIENNLLRCTYIVKNTADTDMFFSVGGHPAFKVPIVDNLQYLDYSLRFPEDAALKRYLLQNGFTGDETETIQLDQHELHLDPSLFYSDAIVLKELKSNEITLHTARDTRSIRFRFEGFPYFGIWAAKDAPFVCLEPWCGIADNIHHDQQLIHKEGINQLPAGGIWERTWSVVLF